MTNLDSILKSRNIIFPIKVCLFKAMVFPVVMCRCESWTMIRRLSTEELMLLDCGAGENSWRVPWAAVRLNQSILKGIDPEYSLAGRVLKQLPLVTCFTHDSVREAVLLQSRLSLPAVCSSAPFKSLVVSLPPLGFIFSVVALGDLNL